MERELFIDYCAREMATATTSPTDPIVFRPRDGEPEDVTAEVIAQARTIRQSWTPEQLASFEGKLARLLD